MKMKLIYVLIIVSMLCMNFFVGASSINTQNFNIKSTSMDDAELPMWAIGNFWKYRMDFEFIARNSGTKTFSVDAAVNDMYATLVDITGSGDEEVYVLSVDGEVTGEVSLFEADINIADFVADLGGTASVNKSNLAIKEFNFEADGKVHIPILGWRDMYFTMVMKFVPGFDFFDFPINENEEPWNVYIENASLYAYVDIDVPFGEQQFSSYMAFNDAMTVNRTETINVPAGIFDTFVLSGTWGYNSNLWYAPVAGYLAKVDEAIYWDNGNIESVFHLDLLDTNYDVSNSPPNPPDKPYGPSQVLMEEDYTYSTTTTDPNGDQVYYWFDFGDGTNTGWLGPYASGTAVEAIHRWYDKGVFIVVAKAKDELGIESAWSEPKSVTVLGDPKVTILMHHIEKKDEIDWSPVGTNSPEWYYMVHAKAEGTGSPPQSYHNTNDGTYNGQWVSNDTWDPDMGHIFTVDSRNVTIKIKLMDHDDFLWEGGNDDLADVSGCNYPDNDGYDDGTPDKRGAIYHGTYDLVTEELKPYSQDPDENADFVYKQGGYYITCGDYEPDNSIEYENGATDPQNDALVWFRLTNDYREPQAIAQLLEPPEKRRPHEELQFLGSVVGGVPIYTWYWDFGDGTIIENQQNPIHAFENKGTYKVTLNITDGFEQISSHSIAVVIRNENPILTNDKVEWMSGGGLRDTFTFSVHYIDPDFDVPTVKTVYIDGKEKTLNGEGSNTVYSLEIEGSEIGRGSHKFYFYFEDGREASAQTSEKTFRVKLSRTVPKWGFNLLSDLFHQFPNLIKLLRIFDLSRTS